MKKVILIEKSVFQFFHSHSHSSIISFSNHELLPFMSHNLLPKNFLQTTNRLYGRNIFLWDSVMGAEMADSERKGQKSLIDFLLGVFEDYSRSLQKKLYSVGEGDVKEWIVVVEIWWHLFFGRRGVSVSYFKYLVGDCRDKVLRLNLTLTSSFFNALLARRLKASFFPSFILRLFFLNGPVIEIQSFNWGKIRTNFAQYGGRNESEKLKSNFYL